MNILTNFQIKKPENKCFRAFPIINYLFDNFKEPIYKAFQRFCVSLVYHLIFFKYLSSILDDMVYLYLPHFVFTA